MAVEATIMTSANSPKWKLFVGDEKYLCIGNVLKDKAYSRLLYAKLDVLDMIELSMVLDDERFTVEPLMILCKQDHALVLSTEKDEIGKGAL